MSEISAIITKYLPDIEQAIQHALEDSPSPLRGILQYHFGWVDQNFAPTVSDSGKRLRPVLSLLVFEALTGNHGPALPAAAALEMIHNFTLIHDDIEDNDLERRGRPTVWSIWGKPQAINAGDYLYTLAFQTLHRLDPARFSPEQRLAVQQVVVEACLELTIGQDMDMRFEQSLAVTTAMYIDMVSKKTGQLLTASMVVGAMLGTPDEVMIGHYREFARNIGIAFQIRDDMLGIWGDAAKTGKSVDNDIRRKKKTLPVLYTLNQLSGPQRDKLHALYAAAEPLMDGEIAFVRHCLAEAGAQPYTRQAADGYIEAAFAALNRIGLANQAHTELEIIARFLVDRAY